VYNSIQLGQSKRLCRKEIGSRQESENNGKHLKTTFQNKTPTRLYRLHSFTVVEQSKHHAMERIQQARNRKQNRHCDQQ
jgi:hypothetical protein